MDTPKQPLSLADIPGDLVSISEAARISGYKAESIRQYIRQGKLRRFGFPSAHRVSLSEVLAPKPIRKPTPAAFKPGNRYATNRKRTEPTSCPDPAPAPSFH